MRDNDYRELPLIVSEYGILLPEVFGYPHATVRDFMRVTGRGLLHEAWVGSPTDIADQAICFKAATKVCSSRTRVTIARLAATSISIRYGRDSWNDPLRRRAAFHLLWPASPYRDDLQILIAGCGTSQAATS